MNRIEKNGNSLVLRKFWQRSVFYLLLGVILSIIIYWLLNLYTPEMLNPLADGFGRRRQVAKLALDIMPAIYWAWLTFFIIEISGFYGDWYYHRFKNLSDEQLR